MAQPTLYLMLGYPGAGKTTTAEIIAKLTGAVHLASDRLRLELFPNPQFTEAEHETVYKVLNQRTNRLLSKGQSVIYDANLNRYAYRAEKYNICRGTGSRPVLIWVRVDRALAKQRAMDNDDVHRRPYIRNDETLSESPRRSSRHVLARWLLN